MVLEEEADIDVGLTCFSIVSASAHTKMKAVAIKSKGEAGLGQLHSRQEELCLD